MVKVVISLITSPCIIASSVKWRHRCTHSKTKMETWFLVSHWFQFLQFVWFSSSYFSAWNRRILDLFYFDFWWIGTSRVGGGSFATTNNGSMTGRFVTLTSSQRIFEFLPLFFFQSHISSLSGLHHLDFIFEFLLFLFLLSSPFHLTLLFLLFYFNLSTILFFLPFSVRIDPDNLSCSENLLLVRRQQEKMDLLQWTAQERAWARITSETPGKCPECQCQSWLVRNLSSFCVILSFIHNHYLWIILPV